MRRKGRHHKPGFLARHPAIILALALPLLMTAPRRKGRHIQTSLLQ